MGGDLFIDAFDLKGSGGAGSGRRYRWRKWPPLGIAYKEIPSGPKAKAPTDLMSGVPAFKLAVRSAARAGPASSAAPGARL